jgi:hypothetical protein
MLLKAVREYDGEWMCVSSCANIPLLSVHPGKCSEWYKIDSSTVLVQGCKALTRVREGQSLLE